MELRIAYCIAAILVAVSFVLFYIIVKPAPQPDMKLSGRLCDDEIKSMLCALAAKQHNTKSVELSLDNVCKIIRKAYKKIVRKEQKEEYEKWIFDNYYKLDERMKELKKVSFAHLQGMDGLPRVYVIASIIVKGSCGSVSLQRIREFVAEFNKVSPLRFSETAALNDAFMAALLEYVAAFAAKSIVITDKVKDGERDSRLGQIDISNFKYLSYAYGYMSTGQNSKLYKDMCERNGFSAVGRCQTFATLLARYASNVSAAIKSLEVKIPDRDLLEMSPLNDYLNKHAVGYKSCTEQTKFYYLNVITQKKENEIEYARKIVSLSDETNKDIGHFLLPKPLGVFGKTLYALLMLAATVGNCVTVYSLAPSLKILFSLLFVPTSLSLVLSFFYAINARLAKRRFLPSAMLDGSEKTLIVFPVLIGSVKAAHEAVNNLKTVAAANRNNIFSYGLVVDLPKSYDAELSSTDKEIIKTLTESVSKLGERFILLIRKRSKVANENYYQGWEKKRGALIELNNFILSGESCSFETIVGNMQSFEYVVTLDEDSMLNCAEQLVRLIKHPYNADKSVISLKMKTDPSSLVTPFATLMNDAKGLSSYLHFDADISYDLFDSGNYTGKGIYRVREFNESVSTLPEGKILSHDFVEGAISGCANSEEEAVDKFPSTFFAYLSRNVRWLRGDYQLLPCLFWKNRKFVSPFIAKTHILTNIVLGLIPVFSAAFAIASLFFMQKTLLFMLAAFAMQAFTILGALPSLFKNPRYVIKETLRQLYLCTCLPLTAFAYLCGISVTVVRLIKGKKLLEWKTAATDNAKNNVLPCVICSLVFLAAFCIKSDITYMLFAVIFGVGTVLPLITAHKKKKSDLVEKDKLISIAKKTWNFFELFLTEEYNYLPCDNIQDGIITKRTSPTNISFMLTSVFCAQKLGFISKEKMTEYIERVVNSIEKLPKWKGNCYNWIDVTDFRSLSPFVSSVDSGNLLASLVLVDEVCEGTLKNRIDELVQKTNIGAFYDNESDLLAIGYDEKTGLTQGKYDLLGSEAMLTYLVGYGLGKLPLQSFYALNRRCVKFKGSSLYSWTGGAFEYMMSGIYFNYPKGSFLRKSATAVMRAHRAYSVEGAWGMSESQYAMTDQNGFFAYKAFGVDKIALSNERSGKVIAPYASLLFLPLFPSAVQKNVYALEKLRLLGKYGFYESYDGKPIRTFMAHHQGMILASIANAVDGSVYKTFASPEMKAASLNLTFSETPLGDKKIIYPTLKQSHRQIFATKTFPKKVNVMTNGEYTVVVDTDGYGYSRYREKCVSRYYDYKGGFGVYVGAERRRLKGKCEICEGITKFSDTYDDFSINTENAVLSVNGEIHRVTVQNCGKKTASVDVFAMAEIALCPLYDDISHKTFSGMFVKVERDAVSGALVASRKGMYAAMVADCETKVITTKSEFFGRANGGFEPALAVGTTLKLAPEEKATVNVYLVVADNRETLSRLIKTVTGFGYDNGAFAAAPALARCFHIDEKLRFAASKIMYDAVPSVISELPTVYFDCDDASYGARKKVATLERLARCGVEFCVAAATNGDGYKEATALRNRGLNVVQVSKNDKSVLKSCTDIDNIVFVTLPERLCGASVTANAPTFCKSVQYKLGYGGFIDNGRAYYMVLDKLPPRPWSNVIAEKNFGTVITERGGGYTFSRNSREQKLTEWSNDPVSDPQSEGVFLVEGDDCFSITKSIEKNAEYTAEHGMGYSEFTCNYGLMQSVQTVFIGGGVKYYLLKLRSFSNQKRKLTAVFFTKPVLGDFAFKTRHNLVRSQAETLTVTNVFSGLKMVMGGSLPVTYYERIRSYSSGEYEAVKSDVEIDANGEAKFYFFLSAGEPPVSDAEQLLAKQKQKYSSLSSVELETGIKSLDYLVKWLPYQTYASRFYGRTGFYQAGGAIGFRDQLQDCLTMLYVDTRAVRNHIITCAAHQFESGDVMHWWHPPCKGVRTKICDDRLFLPLITAEYIDFSGDKSILSERIPYLKDVRLIGKDFYGDMERSEQSETLLKHCIKAIDSERLGGDDLLLIGGGDWNDAMDKVGICGKGETVFGSMFLYYVIQKFLQYIPDKRKYVCLCERLEKGIENSWDGEWYLRAITDDGEKIGSGKCDDLRIDLVTQSFAVISGATDKKRSALAMLSAARKLVDYDGKIIKLLTPPVKNSGLGYIGEYPQGVRENGGQYTHGAIWYVIAAFESGQNDFAFSLLDMLNPINHCITDSDVKTYEVEPYVISADVYASPLGKGGWSWYTGAASWYYVAVLRYMIGLRISGNVIFIEPRLPSKIKQAKLKIKINGITVTVNMQNGNGDKWRYFVGKTESSIKGIPITPSLNGKEITIRKV